MKSLTEYIGESELNNKELMVDINFLISIMEFGRTALLNENIMYTHMKQYLHIL